MRSKILVSFAMVFITLCHGLDTDTEFFLNSTLYTTVPTTNYPTIFTFPENFTNETVGYSNDTTTNNPNSTIITNTLRINETLSPVASSKPTLTDFILSLNRENELNAHYVFQITNKLNKINTDVNKMNYILLRSLKELSENMPNMNPNETQSLVDVIKYCFLRVKMLKSYLEKDRKRLLMTTGMYSSMASRVRKIEAKIEALYKKPSRPMAPRPYTRPTPRVGLRTSPRNRFRSANSTTQYLPFSTPAMPRRATRRPNSSRPGLSRTASRRLVSPARALSRLASSRSVSPRPTSKRPTSKRPTSPRPTSPRPTSAKSLFNYRSRFMPNSMKESEVRYRSD